MVHGVRNGTCALKDLGCREALLVEALVVTAASLQSNANYEEAFAHPSHVMRTDVKPTISSGL